MGEGDTFSPQHPPSPAVTKLVTVVEKCPVTKERGIYDPLFQGLKLIASIHQI
jgi:hypothetical protein